MRALAAVLVIICFCSYSLCDTLPPRDNDSCSHPTAAAGSDSSRQCNWPASDEAPPTEDQTKAASRSDPDERDDPISNAPDPRAELAELLHAAKAAVVALAAAVDKYDQLLGTNLPGTDQPSQGKHPVLPSPAPAAPAARPTTLTATSPTATTTATPRATATATTDPPLAFETLTDGPTPLATYQGFHRQVARGRAHWGEYYRLEAAVKADSDVTAMHSVYENAFSGHCRYLLLGDSGGRLYFLSPSAQVLLDYHTGSSSPITALTSYPLMERGHTLIATGHQDGQLRHHRLIDTFQPGKATPSISNVSLLAVVPHPYNTSDFGGKREGPPSIVFLDVHMQQYAGSTVVVDRWGSHRMVLPGGGVRFTAHTNATILAARKGRTLTALATVDGIWVAVAPPYHQAVRNLRCANLNGTRFLAAAFDVVRPYLLYAVSEDGQLLTMLAPTDNRADACTIWAQRPLGLPAGAFQLLSIKSYLLLAHQLGVAVFNTTAAAPEPPSDVIVEPIANIASLFGSHVGSVERPLAGGSQAHVLALHFGEGLVAVFTGSLPIYRPPNLNLNLWSKPLFIVVMILVGVWQFNRSSNRPQRGHGGGGGMGALSSAMGRGRPALGHGDVQDIIRQIQAEERRAAAAGVGAGIGGGGRAWGGREDD